MICSNLCASLVRQASTQPVRPGLENGKYYKVEVNEESATILCFAADVSWFFCIFTTHVPPTQSKEAVRQSDIPTGPSMMEQPETCQQPPVAGFWQNRSRNELEYFTGNPPQFCRKETSASFRWVSRGSPAVRH